MNEICDKITELIKTEQSRSENIIILITDVILFTAVILILIVL
jgi:hypothetical protein